MSLVNAKIVNASTKTAADSTADTGSVKGNFNSVYYQFEVKSDSPVSVGDYFDIMISAPNVLYMPTELKDDKGEVFATVVNLPTTSDLVEADDVTVFNYGYRYVATRDVDSFNSNFGTVSYNEYRVMDASQYPNYPITKPLTIDVGDSHYETSAIFRLEGRFAGATSGTHATYINGDLNSYYMTVVAEGTTNGVGNGVPETFVTMTLPEDSPLMFKDISSNPYEGVRITRFYNDENDPDIRYETTSNTGAEALSSYIELVKSSEKELVYKILKKDAGGEPLDYRFTQNLLFTDTSFLTKDSTSSSVLQEYPNTAMITTFTTDDEVALEKSGLKNAYDKPISSLGVRVSLSDANAEVKKIDIREDVDGVYQYIQVRDVDTNELVPQSLWAINDNVLPQVPGTNLKSNTIFSRLDGGYEVATNYTVIEDPMTTVLVKRAQFNTVLNAVLEDGTVIKQ